MIYGYARVSTLHQKLEPQIKQLVENGCDRKNIFKEKKSGKNAERTELKNLLDILVPGDKVIVTKIDRIARNLKDGLNIVSQIREKGASIHLLDMGLIDETPMGNLIMSVLLSVAEFERSMILERQREGIEIAKAKGLYKGRPMKYTEKSPKLTHALELYKEGKLTVNEISDITGIGRATIYRKIKEFEVSRAQ